MNFPRTTCIVGFLGICMLATPVNANSLDNLLAFSNLLGLPLAAASEFDDASLLLQCGFKNAGEARMYLQGPQMKISGVIEDNTSSARDIVVMQDGKTQPTCVPKVSISGLQFEEDAIVSASLTGQVGSTTNDVPYSADFSGKLDYDWKTLSSQISVGVEISTNNTDIGQMSLSASLAGIDVIELQRNGQPRQLQQNDFMTARLVNANIQFVDRGIVQFVFELEAGKSNQTARTLQRDAYTSLEQSRQFLDPANASAIGEVITLLQQTLLEGGGGTISVNPANGVGIMEVLAQPSIPVLIQELNISTERIQ